MIRGGVGATSGVGVASTSSGSRKAGGGVEVNIANCSGSGVTIGSGVGSGVGTGVAFGGELSGRALGATVGATLGSGGGVGCGFAASVGRLSSCVWIWR